MFLLATLEMLYFGFCVKHLMLKLVGFVGRTSLHSLYKGLNTSCKRIDFYKICFSFSAFGVDNSTVIKFGSF